MVSIFQSSESHACVQICFLRGSAGSNLRSLDLTIMEVITAINDAPEVSIDTATSHVVSLIRPVKMSPSVNMTFSTTTLLLLHGKGG